MKNLKFSPEVLLELVDIFRKGIIGEKDASQSLREIRLDVDVVSGTLVMPSTDKKD